MEKFFKRKIYNELVEWIHDISAMGVDVGEAGG